MLVRHQQHQANGFFLKIQQFHVEDMAIAQSTQREPVSLVMITHCSGKRLFLSSVCWIVLSIWVQRAEVPGRRTQMACSKRIKGTSPPLSKQVEKLAGFGPVTKIKCSIISTSNAFTVGGNVSCLEDPTGVFLSNFYDLTILYWRRQSPLLLLEQLEIIWKEPCHLASAVTVPLQTDLVTSLGNYFLHL